MLNIVTAFIAPLILYLMVILLGTFQMILEGQVPESILHPLFVYIYAFPVYLTLGVPVAFMIERFLSKGPVFLYYVMVGIVGSIILPFGFSGNYRFSFMDTMFYITAALVFFFSAYVLTLD
ncbi:hypothetical protein BpOF4_17770 [Alkalihalophilus pseudofirmus OF4]|uniref:Uncharacterized protein n=1 Tax=Alkalihalophilus pseudofirmus (strain ATCC BAA-2126 / JCM 17055 / OF4) TaxID=398511 RepID=D3FRK4_ALKPO|nr:hypothetical protein [Alkalihalophilus pseudofirmus]ADC51595.1 hypothetical protein BpOF4_17770 [Alkalihalophilus pseudofirmus OF4]